MPFKELAFSLTSSVRWPKHTDMQLQRLNKVIITLVRAYLLCLKTFEFVSFYMQKLKFSS